MYVLCIFWCTCTYSNVFPRPIRAQGLSWYSVKTQGPLQYTPQSAKLIGHEPSLFISHFYHGPLVAPWIKDIWLI